MKVLHVITSLNVGGAETMLRRLIESDPANIPSVFVVSLTSLGIIGESLRGYGAKVYALNMTSILCFPAALQSLVKLIRQHEPDIVQTWMYHADLLGGLAACLAGNKNIVWGIRHTSLSFGKFTTVLIMKICALLSFWIPKKIICAADASRKQHIKAGYDASRMVVVPNGFDFSQLVATIEQRIMLRRSCHFSESDVVVGCVGRFHSDKGQDIFIKAAAIVIRSCPGVKFLLVGRGCDMNNFQLTGWLKERGLQDRFVLLGERSDVPVCLSAMDIFCLPSRTEGFPNCLGEAMSGGLPCVAARVGDTAFLAGDTAVLVSAQDEQALAAGLLRVINMSPAEQSMMGQSAKARVVENFSIEKASEGFRSIYQEVISKA